MNDIIRLAQTILSQRGLYSGKIDGLAGQATMSATLAAIGKKYGLSQDNARAEEYAVIFLQDYAKSCGIDPGPIDGWYGRKTAAALQKLRQMIDPNDTATDEQSGKLLSDSDISAVAKLAGIEEGLIRAIVSVESRGRGFLSSGDPVILFEGHIFWRQLEARGVVPYQAAKGLPDGILYPDWVSRYYQGGQKEYERLAAAVKVNEDAALCSASWGLFQIMGFHFEKCGFDTVKGFVNAVRISELNQLEAAVMFLHATGLDKPLKAHDWAKFAKGYNGPGYAKNNYHTRLEAAYRRYTA